MGFRVRIAGFGIRERACAEFSLARGMVAQVLRAVVGSILVASIALAAGAGVRTQERPFADWLAALRVEAAAAGIGAATLDRALTGLEPLPIVVERDRGQAELTLSLDDYFARRLTRPTVRLAREMRRKHARVLGRIQKAYAVPPEVLVSVWGLESNFGRFSGTRPTIAALATLAFDERRPALFRRELIDALRIIDRGDIEIEKMKGSWAGAMGQPQFMPSSYLKYAVDFDKNGRRDIWSSLPDVFASTANYLKDCGWLPGRTWGREVRLPAGLAEGFPEVAPARTAGCEAFRQMSEPLPLDRWRTLGVRTKAGGRLPSATFGASLLHAGSHDYLVYGNYEALLAYNCAHAYALSVALLADRIR